MSPSKHAKDTASSKADAKSKAKPKAKAEKVDPDTVGLLADPVAPAQHPDTPYAEPSPSSGLERS